VTEIKFERLQIECVLSLTRFRKFIPFPNDHTFENFAKPEMTIGVSQTNEYPKWILRGDETINMYQQNFETESIAKHDKDSKFCWN